MGAASSREADAARAAAREHTKRCRERRRLMREAVRLRRHLAASHAAYLRSLGVVASALTRFAVGEPLPVSDHTPPAVIAHRAVVVPSSPPPLLRAMEQPQPQGEARQQEVGSGVSADVGVGVAAPTRTEGVGVGGGAEEELRMVVRHRSLAEVAAGLEEYFVKASVAGDTVSSLLEANTTEFKGGSHSFLGALCCLSAPPLDRIDSMSSRQRHSATLQQLLAWEKKLYKDVKVIQQKNHTIASSALLLPVAKNSHWNDHSGQGEAANKARQEARRAARPGVQPEDRRGHPEAQGGVGQGARAARDRLRVRGRDLVRRRAAPRHAPRAPAPGALPRRARHVAGDAAAPRGAEPVRAAAARAEQPHVHGTHDGDPPPGDAGARGRHERLVRGHGAHGQAPARLRPRHRRLAQAHADADAGQRRRRGLVLGLNRGGGARGVRRPVGEGARPRALRGRAQGDQELRGGGPRDPRAPGRRAAGGAAREAVLPGAGPQVQDAAAGGEELLRLVPARGHVDVALGEAGVEGPHAGARRGRRGGAAQGRDRGLPEDGGGRDAEACQGHRRHEDGHGHRRAGEAACRVPGHGRVLGVACEFAGGRVQSSTAEHQHAVVATVRSFFFAFAFLVFIVFSASIHTKIYRIQRETIEIRIRQKKRHYLSVFGCLLPCMQSPN